MATNGNGTIMPQEQFKEQSSTGSDSASNNPSLGKDEVGWYFVEQYYTTLSRTPEKAHLYYGKRSQFVYGNEAEVANVSVGRAAIQERIKELNFLNSKVRISNVDSMASFENIVIQVIGESSHQNAEPRKFSQTFVLAPQPSGYFVVNDILRFISDEDIEAAEDQEEPATQEPAAPAADEKADEKSAAPAVDVEAVEKKIEQVAIPVAPETKAAEPAPVEAPKVEQAPAQVETSAQTTADPEAAARELAEEDAQAAEKPVDPKPTPAPAAAAPAQPAEKPAAPPAPAKPMSWASRAAAAVGHKPVMPLQKNAAVPAPAAAPAPAQAKAAPAPASSASTPAASQQAPAAASQTTESKESQSSEWQSVSDSKRQNRPQSISGPPADSGALGYVKYVTDKVKTEDLKAALQQYGELTYFDVNRQKNCAFVEFASPAGYQAAAAANPLTVNGESITVEPRRPKAGAYGGSNYSGRGNVPNRGRGGYDGQRSGSQGGGRGGFTSGQNRGRGGAGGAPRGRGASQSANA